MSFVVIEGKATADATLREFPSRKTGGLTPISNVTVAVNDRRYNAETEQWVDTGTTYYEVTVLGLEAVHFANTAIKGARLIAAGNCFVEEHRDNDGNTRQRRRINAGHHGLPASSSAHAPVTPRPTTTDRHRDGPGLETTARKRAVGFQPLPQRNRQTRPVQPTRHCIDERHPRMSTNSDTWPFHVGQKVSATFVDHDGEHTVPAWVTLVYPARGGYGVVANTGEPRALNFHVPPNGRHDRIAPAA